MLVSSITFRKYGLDEWCFTFKRHRGYVCQGELFWALDNFKLPSHKKINSLTVKFFSTQDEGENREPVEVWGDSTHICRQYPEIKIGSSYFTSCDLDAFLEHLLGVSLERQLFIEVWYE
jgi:hypothetical protein